MSCIKRWWEISKEGRLVPPPRKVWLTNSYMRKWATAAFTLSFLTIGFIWFLFVMGYMPQFKTSKDMLHLASMTPLRTPVVFVFFITYILGHVLYGGGYSQGIAPEILIFKPVSFCEGIRALFVLAHEILLLIGIAYLGPIALLCELLGIVNLGVQK